MLQTRHLSSIPKVGRKGLFPPARCTADHHAVRCAKDCLTFPRYAPSTSAAHAGSSNGEILQHLKKMQPSGTAPRMRIRHMRSPSMSATNSQSSPPQPLQSQSSQSQPTQPPSSAGSPITHHQSPPAPSLVLATQNSVPNLSTSSGSVHIQTIQILPPPDAPV